MEGRTQTSRDKSKYRFVGSKALKPICSKDVIQDFLFSHGKKQTARTRIRIIKVKRIQRETQTQRRKSLFDWPVAFTKVILIAANCTLAKCSEEHVNHKK